MKIDLVLSSLRWAAVILLVMAFPCGADLSPQVNKCVYLGRVVYTNKACLPGVIVSKQIKTPKPLEISQQWRPISQIGWTTYPVPVTGSGSYDADNWRNYSLHGYNYNCRRCGYWRYHEYRQYRRDGYRHLNRNRGNLPSKSHRITAP